MGEFNSNFNFNFNFKNNDAGFPPEAAGMTGSGLFAGDRLDGGFEVVFDVAFDVQPRSLDSKANQIGS
jgi:hypothetical protein